MNNKIRIRTTEELEDRKERFLEICKVLDEMDITYFLIGGVLLGAKRDKKFIEWDWDVEINLFIKDLNSNFSEILKKLLKNNFQIWGCRKNDFDSKIDFYKNYGTDVTHYTLNAWNHDKKNKIYYRNRISFPDHFLEEFELIEFYGKNFNAPKPIEEYLSYQFGDWKTRKRTDVKSSYMTSKFYRRDSFASKIAKFIFRRN